MSATKVIIIFGFLLFILGLRFSLFYQNAPKYKEGQPVNFHLTLYSEPKIYGNLQNISFSQKGSKPIYITLPAYPVYHYLDTLNVSGKIAIKEIGLSNQNNQPLENPKKSQIFTIANPKVMLVKNNNLPGFSLALISSIRQKIITIFNRTLPPTSASLLLGILFGIKDSLPKSLLNDLRVSGVVHIIAASGMHVGIIGGFLCFFLSAFFKRRYALLLTILGIIFYALLAGLRPSIVRASIMGILVFSAQILGRQTLSFYSLFLSAYGMLFYSPSLIGDVGFQLSFLATGGIIYVRPLFVQTDRLKRIFNKSILGDSFSTTVSAQAATLPVLVSNFGIYSVWSSLVNLMVLWTVPVLMILGGIGAVLGLIFAPLGQILLFLTLPFLIYFEKTVSVFSSFGGVLEFNYFPWQISAGYYLILTSLVLVLRKRK